MNPRGMGADAARDFAGVAGAVFHVDLLGCRQSRRRTAILRVVQVVTP
jgi:hypothetical protein